MARRTIKTVDRQVFSGSSSRFEDHKGYILFKVSLFDTVRIVKRNIVSDDINGLSAPAMMALTVFILMALTIGFLLLNRKSGSAATQNSVYLPGEVPVVVIASRKSGLYYLPECPEYIQVKPEHRVSFDSEQRAYEAGYRKSKKCPR